MWESLCVRPEHVAGLDVPTAAASVLTEVGLPTELRLPGGLAPTLFTNETAEGLKPDGTGSSMLGYVIGSVRETLGARPGEQYAFFCLQRDGAISLLEGPGQRRYVNASIAQFLNCLKVLLGRWPDWTPDALSRALEQVDASVLADPESYWNTWVEEVGLA